MFLINPYNVMCEEMFLTKLEKSRESVLQGKCKPAGRVVADMRKKYNLEQRKDQNHGFYAF